MSARGKKKLETNGNQMSMVSWLIILQPKAKASVILINRLRQSLSYTTLIIYWNDVAKFKLLLFEI